MSEIANVWSLAVWDLFAPRSLTPTCRAEVRPAATYGRVRFSAPERSRSRARSSGVAGVVAEYSAGLKTFTPLATISFGTDGSEVSTLYATSSGPVKLIVL